MLPQLHLGLDAPYCITQVLDMSITTVTSTITCDVNGSYLLLNGQPHFYLLCVYAQ